jgi:hypothetical protein
MGKKKIIGIIAILITLTGTAIYMRPLNLGKIAEIENGTTMHIISLRGTVDFSDPGFKSDSYEYGSGSGEYEAILKLFRKYHYHASLRTLTKNTLMHRMDYLISIKTSRHSVTINDNSPLIIIDGIPYKIGYFGKSESKALAKEMLEIIKEE